MNPTYQHMLQLLMSLKIHFRSRFKKIISKLQEWVFTCITKAIIETVINKFLTVGWIFKNKTTQNFKLSTTKGLWTSAMHLFFKPQDLNPQNKTKNPVNKMKGRMNWNSITTEAKFTWILNLYLIIVTAEHLK